MTRLKEKVAVVTGGGAGIGRATCELFADEGAAVVIAERNVQTGQETAEHIRSKGGRAQFVETDVADESHVQRMVAKHVVPHMRKAGGGAIVNLASISSFIAQPHFVTYNATKAAIASMTRCMALDLAPDNIRVNAVGPGAVWTQIVQRLTSEAGMDRATADRHPDWGGAHMIKRIAEP